MLIAAVACFLIYVSCFLILLVSNTYVLCIYAALGPFVAPWRNERIFTMYSDFFFVLLHYSCSSIHVLIVFSRAMIFTSPSSPHAHTPPSSFVYPIDHSLTHPPIHPLCKTVEPAHPIHVDRGAHIIQYPHHSAPVTARSYRESQRVPGPVNATNV